MDLSKILSLVLALVLLFALAVTAQAAPGTAYYKDGVIYWDVTGIDGDLSFYLQKHVFLFSIAL